MSMRLEPGQKVLSIRERSDTRDRSEDLRIGILGGMVRVSIWFINDAWRYSINGIEFMKPFATREEVIGRVTDKLRKTGDILYGVNGADFGLAPERRSHRKKRSGRHIPPT